MSKPIVTKQMLIDADACQNQVDLFEKTFGDSVVVTLSRAKKVANLFQWDWAVQLLDGQGYAEYRRAMTAAWAEYERAAAPALAEYNRVREAARPEYTRSKEAEWAEYKRVQAVAWAEYKRVEATAWSAAFIDMHKRGASA